MKEITIRNKPTFFINKDFRTILIKVFFPFKRKEEELAFMSLLPNMLNIVDEKYPTESEFSLQLQRLFISGCYCSISTLGEEGYVTCNLVVPESSALPKNMLEEQFEFFSQMIYHPKHDKDSFCEEEFQREVDNLRIDIEKFYNDTNSYAMMRAKEIVDPNGRFSTSIYNHKELIDTVTKEELYQFYLRTIYHNHPFIYVFGNVDQKEITSLCNKYLYLDSFKESTVPVEIKNYLPIRNQVSDVVEESHFRNSVYLSFYKVKDMCEEDEVLLTVVQGLLSSQTSRILNKKLRDENDLVYSAHAISFNTFGLLCIATFINQKNIEQVREKVEDVLLDLKNEELIAPYLEMLKEKNRLSLIRKLDDKWGLFQDSIIKDLGIDLTAEEFYQKLLLVTPKDVSCFMDRLVLDTKYFLKEREHE